MEGYIDAYEAAARSGFSRTYLYAKVREGKLACRYEKTITGKRMIFKISDIDCLLHDTDKYYTKKEFMKLCHCGHTYLNRLIDEGYVTEYWRDATHFHLTRDSVDKFMDSITFRGNWRTDEYFINTEAARFTGLSVGYLRNRVADGTLLIGMKLPSGVFSYWKKDLEDLIAPLKKLKEDGYISVADAAKSVSYSPEYLRVLAVKGKIRSGKYAGNVFVNKEDVDKFFGGA